MESYQTYYSRIEKPVFAPAPKVFGIAWGIIYPLIILTFAIVLYRIWRKTLAHKILVLLVINIVANLCFTPLQLGFPNALWATIDILLILVTLGWLQYIFLKQKEWLLLTFLLPYTLWASFATILQITIYFLNFA